jgi:hypothetical protein
MELSSVYRSLFSPWVKYILSASAASGVHCPCRSMLRKRPCFKSEMSLRRPDEENPISDGSWSFINFSARPWIPFLNHGPL